MGISSDDSLIKWEYCCVDLSEKPGVVNFFEEDKIREYQLPGRRKDKADKNWQAAAWRYIAGLGKQGWELVLSSNDSQSLTSKIIMPTTFVFKRPFQEKSSVKSC